MRNQDADIEYTNNEADRVGQQAFSEARIEARNLGGQAATLYDTIVANVTEATKHAEAAHGAQVALADRDHPPDPGTVKDLTAKVGSARMEVRARLTAADTGVDVLKQILLAGSLPKLEDSAERAEARVEVELLLADAGNNLASKMAAIAKGPDRRQAAIVVGSWGLAKLRGDAEAHRGLALQSLDGTMRHGTATEKAHAVAFTRLPTNLGKALAVSGLRARQRAGG